MLPLVDDFLMAFLNEKLAFLKKYPELIDRLFSTGNRETLKSLKNFITKKKVNVIIGYPREQSQLPCYVIVLAPEQEVPMGLGDEEGLFDEEFDGLGGNPDEIEDDAEAEKADMINAAYETIAVTINGTYMATQYRIECWSDNGDLTSYMYAILKWAMWTSRMQMFKLGWANVSVSGTDLEPAPDYLPVFVYRRSIMVSAQVENLYFSDTSSIEAYLDIIHSPDDYYEDEEGNICRKSDDEIVLPARYKILIRDHWYQSTIDTGIV